MRRPGFTLIELMISIAILAIIAAIVIVAINPTKQIAQAQNAQRSQNINTILNAFYQYSLDNGGKFQDPAVVTAGDCTIPISPAPARKICLPSVSAAACDFGALDDGNGCIYTGLIIPKYIVDIPLDPQDSVGGNDDLQSDYTIALTGGGKHLRVIAPNTVAPPAPEILSVER